MNANKEKSMAISIEEKVPIISRTVAAAAQLKMTHSTVSTIRTV